MAKFNLTATVNTSLAGTTLTGAEGLGTTLSGQQGLTVGVLNGVGATGPQGPTGATGAPGADGAAATIGVGTVTTGAAGSSASVTNSGTSSAATFDFSIPRGDTGNTGPAGPTGAGFTGGSYNSSTGVVTFTSNDNLGFSTGDLRGADGTGSGTVTSVEAGGGLTGGTITSFGTISHADTSTQANVDATANTYVDGLTFDDYGHVTGVSTVAGFDGNYSSLAGAPTLFDGAYGSLTGVPTTFAPSSHALSSHSDVSTASPTDGQVLAWNNTGSTWEPQTVSGGGSSPTVVRQTKVATSTLSTGAGTLTWTHGQNAAPVLFWAEVECIVNTNGALVGDIRQIFSGERSEDDLTIFSRGTTTLHAAWDDEKVFEIVNRYDTGNVVLQDAKWKVGLAGLWL